MATRKTSQLTELITTPANNDLVMVVDVSDTTMSSSGTNKKVTVSTLATAIVAAGSVSSVNGQTGTVVLDSADIWRTGSSGDTVDTDLTAIEADITGIKARLASTTNTTTVQVDSSNKMVIDNSTNKAVITVAGVTAATIGDARSLFPALRVGGATTFYDLPASRGTTTGQVPVFDSGTNTTTFQALKVAELDGDSDDLPEGTTNLFLTSSERTKLAGITAGAAVASVTGTAPIVSSGGTTPAISITAATTSAAGSMSSADKTKLDGITAGAAVASVTGTAPIVSSGGTTPAISITAATTSAAGSMSSADKTKLDGIEAGAQVNAVTSVNSQTGAVSLTTSNISEGTNLYYTDARFDTRLGTKSTTNLAEGTNLYFTNARADARTLAEKDQTLTAARTIDLALESLSIVDGSTSVAGFVNGVQVLYDILRMFSNTATAPKVEFYEGGTGSNYVALKAPNSLASNTTYTLPSADGVEGQAVVTDGAGTLSLGNPFAPVASSSSTSYTLASGDAGKYIRFTATTAVTVTIPSGTFSTGTEFLFEQNNTGQVTVSAGSGVTLRNSASFLAKTSERYSIIGLKCVASNEFVLTGERELV